MDAMFLVPIVQKPVKDALVGNYQLHSGIRGFCLSFRNS